MPYSSSHPEDDDPTGVLKIGFALLLVLLVIGGIVMILPYGTAYQSDRNGRYEPQPHLDGAPGQR